MYIGNMYIGNSKHLNCEIHLNKLIILVPQLRLKVNFSNSTLFHDLRNWPQKKKVAQTELYDTLIFNITHIGESVWAGESDRMPFIDRTEYYNLSC